MELDGNKIEEAISSSLEKFYQKRSEKLNALTLDYLLKRKNPYLFRGKGATVSSEVVQELVLAFMSSSEETMFGNLFFEEVALVASGGDKSIADSIDIVIHTEDSIKAIAVKSGTSVFNSQSKRRQQQAFEEMRKRLSTFRKHFDPIVGYAYGKKTNRTTNRMNFRELAGQAFWEEITGDSNFYLKLAQLMKEKPQEQAMDYKEAFGAAINRLSKEFTERFCDERGYINWDKWIVFNSGIQD